MGGRAVREETWFGAYDDSWGDLIVPEAYAHPAKAAKNLAYRICKHGIERNYWQVGATILDPFAGVGCFGIAAAAHGLKFIGVELEENFVSLARETFAMHAREWELAGKPQPVILQGDSRRLTEIVGQVAGAVTSPPYIDTGVIGPVGKKDIELKGNILRKQGIEAGYGSSPGQIGAMPEGHIGGAVTSPPYVESLHRWSGKENQLNIEKRQYGGTGYGSAPGQIGTMPEGCITSPPYEKSAESGSRHGHSGITKRWAEEGKPVAYFRYTDDRMSANLGNQAGETYWSAVRLVYSQVYDLLVSNGVAAIVVKPFVRRRALVPLPEMTAALLENIGFEIVEWTKAMFARGEQAMLGGGTYKKERKSFFRRLAERKGAPTIDAEIVIWARKPQKEAG